MTYARTIAATINATIFLTVIAQASAPAAPSPEPVVVAVAAAELPVASAAVVSPPAISEPVPETIAGVRIVSSDGDTIAFVNNALDKFDDAGWPLDNLEIRTDGEDGCGGNAGVRYIEEGYDVVEICTDAEWALLHELGHVWSGLYLDDAERQEWVAMRGLEFWSEGAEWSERGTEQVADIIAFGLRDTWYTPTSISSNDRASLIEGFTWLFGIAPLHLTKNTDKVTSPSASEKASVAAFVLSPVAPELAE